VKESVIQENIMKKLRWLEWFCKSTHGNLYQSGFPDIFACHVRYGPRWIECKQPDETKSYFTAAQLETFPKMDAAGCGIWVMTTDTDHEYAKLFQAPNWRQYYMKKILGGR
jgi:hypothetical protein